MKEKKEKAEEIIEEDYTEAFEEPVFTATESPEPTIRDVILKLETLKNEVIGSANGLEAKMFDIGEQMNQLNMAFVGVSAELAELRNRKAGIPERQIQPKQQIEKVQPVGFDVDDLMKHNWKGKKIGDRKYAPANSNYGWDFKDQFADATLNALGKGKVAITDYEFELKGRIVSMQKIKRSRTK